MKKTIELHGKKITFPCRMFKPKDIKEMGIAYVEESIYFNIAKPNQAFEAIESHIEKNMGIINYPDFSATSFSNELLLQSCQDQINSNSDFITLPKFKDETEHETIQKLELAREIKKLTDKPIILEIAYNTNLDSRILEDKKENFDYISIFYGVKYGHLSQYEKLITRIVEIKMLTNKRVFS